MTVNRPPIDTFLFDLGGVLIDWSPRYLFARHFTGRTHRRASGTRGHDTALVR
jgi:FMN phosphatase YigB (HAD superfamily)